jgi:hypothetical protein
VVRQERQTVEIAAFSQWLTSQFRQPSGGKVDNRGMEKAHSRLPQPTGPNLGAKQVES